MVAANRAAVISNGVNTDCNHAERNVSINPSFDIDPSIQLIDIKVPNEASHLTDRLNNTLYIYSLSDLLIIILFFFFLSLEER